METGEYPDNNPYQQGWWAGKNAEPAGNDLSEEFIEAPLCSSFGNYVLSPRCKKLYT